MMQPFFEGSGYLQINPRIGKTRKQWSRYRTSMLHSVPQRFPSPTLSKLTIWRWTNKMHRKCRMKWKAIAKFQEKYFSRMVRHVTSMCTTTTPKRWWTGTTPSDAVSCIFCRFPSWQWCKFTHKWQESYHDSPTNYKNLETFGKRKHNYCSPNYKSCLMITWFRLLIPPSQSLNSLSI